MPWLPLRDETSLSHQCTGHPRHQHQLLHWHLTHCQYLAQQEEQYADLRKMRMLWSVAHSESSVLDSIQIAPRYLNQLLARDPCVWLLDAAWLWIVCEGSLLKTTKTVLMVLVYDVCLLLGVQEKKKDHRHQHHGDQVRRRRCREWCLALSPLIQSLALDSE